MVIVKWRKKDTAKLASDRVEIEIGRTSCCRRTVALCVEQDIVWAYP